MRPMPLVVSLAFLAACQAARPRTTPMTALRDVDVRYRAELAPQRGAKVPATGPSAESAAPERASKPPGTPIVQLDCRIYALDADAARALAPSASNATFARVVTMAELERVRREWTANGVGELRTAPSLTLFDGGLGTLSVSSQTAFVQGFTIESVPATDASPGGMIGDPRVEVVQEGLTVEAKSTIAAQDGGVRLDVALRQSELLKPFEEATVCLPGTSTALALQIPIGFEQELSAVASLAPDEVLVLGSLPAKDGKHFVACIRAKRAGTEVASAAAPAH